MDKSNFKFTQNSGRKGLEKSEESTNQAPKPKPKPECALSVERRQSFLSFREDLYRARHQKQAPLQERRIQYRRSPPTPAPVTYSRSTTTLVKRADLTTRPSAVYQREINVGQYYNARTRFDVDGSDIFGILASKPRVERKQSSASYCSSHCSSHCSTSNNDNFVFRPIQCPASTVDVSVTQSMRSLNQRPVDKEHKTRESNESDDKIASQ